MSCSIQQCSKGVHNDIMLMQAQRHRLELLLVPVSACCCDQHREKNPTVRGRFKYRLPMHASYCTTIRPHTCIAIASHCCCDTTFPMLMHQTRAVVALDPAFRRFIDAGSARRKSRKVS